MRTHSILVAFLLMSASLFSQISVQVNSDGTHTVLHHHGNTIIGINTDGSQSIMHQNGNMITGINSDGTHSTGHVNGNMLVMVNSNGTHSAAIVNGNIINIMDSNGKSSVIHHHGNIGVQNNADGTQNIFHFPVSMNESDFTFQFGVHENIFSNFFRSIFDDNNEAEIETWRILSKYFLLIY
ncbi:MAG: hypothetical protein IPI60_15010 [Saprospiraceae bacterium]|nr:hypothetical protein [Saprospiraceae bacterium]